MDKNLKDIDQAQRSAGNSSFAIPPFFKEKKNALMAVGALMIIIVIGFLVWQFFPSKPATPAQFTLEAVSADTAGVDPGTAFILKSTQALSGSAIKKILKFNPEIGFSVKKTGGVSSLVNSAFAQSPGSETTQSVYEIKPAETLKGSEIYRAEITDGSYADHEYSWAFQVKSVFQVVQTHPRDKGTDVPVNSGVEIVFNRENLLNPQDYFEITPKIDGTFEQHGDTLVFLPKNFAAGTVYKVTIKKGLKSQGSEDVLGEDYLFSFETGGGSYSGSQPYFNLGSDFLEFVPGKKPTFEVYYSNLNLAGVNLNVYKFSGADEFLKSYQDSRQWEWGWTRFYRDGYTGYDPSGQQKILSFNPSPVKVGYQNFIEIPQVLEPGYYILDVVIGGRHEQAWLQITPLSRYFSVSHDKGLLWVYDFLKKEPVSNLKTVFLDKNGSRDLGVTNQEGLVEFDTPDSLKEENKSGGEPKFLRVEQKNYAPFLIKISDSWDWRQQASKGDLYWNYLSTDRYVYQMSDTVNYWGVVKGRQEDLRQKKVTVGVYSYTWWGGLLNSDEQKPFVSQEVLISQFDTIEGKLNFKGIAPGYYTVAVTMGNDVISTTEIEVITYSKPAYQITVTPSRQTVYAGENVNFQVKASFFDGTPVDNLKLRYNGYWQNSFEGELTLDGNGVGNFSYTPQYFETQYTYYPRTLFVSFSPASSEEGEITGDGSVLVFGPNLYLQANQERMSGDTYKFSSKLNKIAIDNLVSDDSGSSRYEYIGEPMSGYSLTAKIVKVTYGQRETGKYYDPIDKVVRKQYSYFREEHETETLSGATNGAGEWSFEKNLPTEEGSYYEIIFSGKDDRGRKISAMTFAGYASYNQWKEFGVALSIGSESYSKEFSVGDKVKLQMQIVSGAKPDNAKVLFYRYQNSINETKISSDLNFEENFSEASLPSVQYQAVVLGPYGFEETNSVVAYFKKTDRKLTIDINPDKTSYRPGDQVNVGLAVKDKNNKPVEAQVNVAAVDEALFHILPSTWRPKILETLYSNIQTYLISGASQYANLKSPGAEGGGCFAAGTPVLMSDGSSKPIEKIRVGDEVLTLETENGQNLKPAIVQGISRHLVEGYLIINDAMKVTPEHKIFLNGQWAYAAQAKVGDVLRDSSGQPQMIYSVREQKLKNALVYNIVVGDYHTYFAGGYFVHNAEKGASPRTDFADVALYKTVQTDSRGRAQVSFKAPDNITAWRTTALAFSTATMQAGESEKLIDISLPFFIDATLSNYYLIGDNPYLRLRPAGVDHKNNELTDFTVFSQTLNLDRKESSKSGDIFIQLGQLKEGEHKIKISAKQGGLQDSLVRNIEVVKSYFKKAESTQYELSDSLSGIAGNQGGFTKLLFVDEGRGKFYNALWSNAIIGGIRADQITANYFATQMLAQYFKEPPAGAQLDLSGYQTPSGGVGLFTYGDDDLELSAKIADLAPDFISQNDLKNYFNASLVNNRADIHRIAKTLYGLAALKQPVLLKINAVKDNKDLTLEDKIYLGLALAKLGDKENARQLYTDFIRPQVRFQGPDGWLAEEADATKQVKLTSDIAVLASYLNVNGDKDGLWNYISSHSPERDLNELERVMVIKTEMARIKDQTVKFSYRLGGKKEDVKLENGQPYSMTVSEDEIKNIKFSDIEGRISLISFYERSRNPEDLAKNIELGLTRKYFVNNQPTNTFSEGSIVLVRLDPSIANSAIDGNYQIVDYLPSGLRPVTQLYEKDIPAGSSCDSVWYPSKIVDNAVYFNVWKGFDQDKYCANRTVNYYARVVSKGSFQANPALLQSLQDLNSLNISAKDSVEIK